MIYPDVTPEEWSKKYKIPIKKSKCPFCFALLTTSRPFIEKKFIGLIAPACVCGYQSAFSTQKSRDDSLEFLFILGGKIFDESKPTPVTVLNTEKDELLMEKSHFNRSLKLLE